MCFETRVLWIGLQITQAFPNLAELDEIPHFFVKFKISELLSSLFGKHKLKLQLALFRVIVFDVLGKTPEAQPPGPIQLANLIV